MKLTYIKTQNLFTDTSTIIETAKHAAYHSVNIVLVQRNWLLGKRIVEEQLGNQTREELYGQKIVENLAKELTEQYGSGFDFSSLYKYIRFYQCFPNILDAASPKSFLLTWTHYRILLQVEDKTAREWYANEAAKEVWSTKTLQRNISSQYYYRLLKAPAPEKVKTEMQQLTQPLQDKNEFIKNPVVAEFLGLSANTDYTESTLEKAILTNPPNQSNSTNYSNWTNNQANNKNNNDMKNSTFSAQVANNLLTLLQGYSKTIRLLLVMLLTLTVSANAWGTDVVYKTAKFGSSYNSAKVSSYTSSWYSTYNGFRVDIVNANNNQNGWSYIKMGSKTAASTGTITTNAKIDAAITQVSLKIDAITASNITSITLKTATSSNGTYTSVGTFTKATGTQTVTLASPTANLFYKIEVVCTKGSSNGLITISQVDYYKSDVVATPEYNITYTGDEHITYTSTKPETIQVDDQGFELEFSVNDGYQLNDVQVKMGGQDLVINDDYYWEESYLLILPETDITGDIVITFVTVSTCTTNPTVSAGSNSNVTTTTATVSCSDGITSLGSAGCSIESYGFVYGTSSNPTISNTKVQVGTTYTTTGTAFSKELTGLTANTTYYVRPYATNGNGTAYGTQTSFKTLELPKYTVTLNAGPGTCAASVTETSAGAGVTLPTPTLDGCDEWSFAGWKTTSAVTTETTTEPTLIAAGAYSPTSDITLYAVYQRTEGGGGTEYVLTDIGEISSGDIFVFADASNYALTNNNGTSSAVGVKQITVSNSKITSTVDATIEWQLTGNNTNGYTFYPGTGTTTWLYCNTTASSSNNNNMRVGTGDRKLFVVNNNGYLVTNDTYTDRYLSRYNTQDFRGYTNTNTNPVKPKLYKKTAGSTTYYHSTPDCGGDDPEPTGYTITFEAYGGTRIDKITDATALPNPLPTTTRAHYTFAGWFTDEDCTQAATAGATIDADITLYAKWTPITYTVTFNAGSGTCATEPTQGNFETGLELPTATPRPYASTNGWSFVGWSESSVSETTVRPAIHTGNYKPTKNITLHAVYKKTGIAQGGDGEFILSLEYETTTYYVGQTFDNNKLSAETEQTNAARFTIEDNYLHYEGGYISHVAEGTANMTKQADKANAQAWTITEETNTIIFTSTADNTRGLGFNYNNGSPRFAAYKLNEKDGETIKYPSTFTKTSVSGGNVQVTTYNSNPSCEAPVDPTWGEVTINHSSIQVVCGSKTPLNAADPNGPATITFNGSNLVNPVTVTASEGFLVSTDKTTLNKYATEVTINPYKEGQNAGKLPNVHVIADATAKNENYDGTITLTGADITNGSQVINVTAAVTCTQYTITWSVNGDDSHQVTYSPGGALQLPEIDITPCDGMDHVGWTDNMGYDHGTDILFTETTDMTVTSDKTYYAVFATSTSSDGGEITLDFSSKGYTNAQEITSVEQDDITVRFDKGTNNNNPPKYYTSGKAVRAYGGNTFTVSSDNTITQITITFGSDDGTNEITTDSGNYSDGTWTGSANEITFTIGGSSGNRRIASIAVTSAGGGASYYTDYTTTCEGRQLETPTNLQATDITHNGATLTWDAVAGANKYEVVIDGTEYLSNTNSYTTHDLKPQTAYTWTVQAIGNGTTFTDSEISAEATFTTGTALTITWSVSTVTSTTTITKGQPIGTNLKNPATPDACEGKYFMGWSASSTVNSDGSDFTPITSDIVPETNVTYYAVFAEPTGNGGAQGELFSESFNTMNGKGGNDDAWNGSIATTKLESFGDWTLSSVYQASACIKLGAGSAQGSVTTPALGINGSATLTFNAGAWNAQDEKTQINLTIVGEGSIAPNSVTLTKGQFNTYTANITGANADTKVQFIAATKNDNRFFLDEVKVSGGSSDSYTDYSTSCGTYTVTFYGFNSGGYTTTCDDNPAEIAVAQGETYQIPDCEPTFDPAELGRTFAGTWNTQANGKGTAYKPGDEIANVSNDITLYAQWALNTSGNTTLPTDVEDLATTDIVVTGGTTLTLQAGTTTINSLTLKGGLQENGSYAMPVVNIPTGATLVRNNNKINLDLKVNNNSYYPFAVPFEVANTAANVNYINTTLKEYANDNNGYGKYYRILEYNGALRAENGVNSAENWVHVGRTDVKLMPGKGYAISAVPASGQDTVTIRITMTVDNAWLSDGEQESITVKEQTTTRNAVAVAAHAGAAATEHQRHAGWNFVANPYLANFAGTNASGSFINGEIIINKGDYSYGGEDVPYVTIPTYNFAHYYQVKLSEATLSPAYSFFVQVGESGTMTFDVAGRQAAPASIAARNAEERPVKMDVDITLSDNHSSDQTGIIISDRYSDAYEIGRDLEKLFGSAHNLSVYTLMADNTPLAFQALAIRSSMQVIPVGYRAPEQGEYTFRLNEATSSIDLLNEQYEQLVLVDYQTGELTNLLIADYTFYSERTQADNRFAIYAVPRQNAPTDLPNAIGQDKQAQKILHNGHLYILRDGNVYNGNGQIVK